MIGSGLKKFAQANGLSVDGGVGYGNLRGFQATLCEGSGFKQITIQTKFPDVEKLNALQAALNSVNLQREYRVQQLSFTPNGITIIFLDNPGTMKKIEAFTDWFFPQLAETGAYGANICPECGLEMESGVWRMVSGVAGCYHSACAEKLSQELAAESQARTQADNGTYVSGTIGALLGALLGAIAWAIILNSGYILSILGLLIAFLADKGYDLLKGRQGKGKIAILIGAVIIGVTAGTALSLVLQIVTELSQGLFPAGWTYADIPEIFMICMEDPDISAAMISNFGQGMLFAAIGVVLFITQAAKKVTDPKMKELK